MGISVPQSECAVCERMCDPSCPWASSKWLVLSVPLYGVKTVRTPPDLAGCGVK